MYWINQFMKKVLCVARSMIKYQPTRSAINIYSFEENMRADLYRRLRNQIESLQKLRFPILCGCPTFYEEIFRLQRLKSENSGRAFDHSSTWSIIESHITLLNCRNWPKLSRLVKTECQCLVSGPLLSLAWYEDIVDRLEQDHRRRLAEKEMSPAFIRRYLWPTQHSV